MSFRAIPRYREARNIQLGFMKSYFVYVTSNTNLSVFYTGVTNNLARRIYEHKHKLIPGYTSKYNLDKLLYFEESFDAYQAIVREKQIKKYSQKKKIDLIQKQNPRMNDLYDKITG